MAPQNKKQKQKKQKWITEKERKKMIDKPWGRVQGQYSGAPANPQELVNAHGKSWEEISTIKIKINKNLKI